MPHLFFRLFSRVNCLTFQISMYEKYIPPCLAQQVLSAEQVLNISISCKKLVKQVETFVQNWAPVLNSQFYIKSQNKHQWTKVEKMHIVFRRETLPQNYKKLLSGPELRTIRNYAIIFFKPFPSRTFLLQPSHLLKNI